VTGRPPPLNGVTVLDLGQVYQGPYAGFLMAMAGARVIKVEPPRGEILRARGPSLPFAMLNSNKECVTLNLKEPAGAQMLRDLAAHADVMLVNYSPEVPARLGIDWNAMSAVNPRLIYAHATAFGLDAEGSVPGMDITVQAHTGIMAVTGHAGTPPVKAGVALVDFLGGSHLYAAITTALFERERTGLGRSVEVTMSDAAHMTMATCLSAWHMTGETPRTGNGHPAGTLAPYDVYECADGHFAIIVISNKQWRSFAVAIERPDLVDDPRFASNADRAQHVAALDQAIGSWARTRSKNDVVSSLREAHVPVAAVRDIDEVVNDPETIRRGSLQWIDHPELGNVPLPHSPIRWHESELIPIDPSHPIGSDNAAVFGGLLGLTASDLDELSTAGVI
jgi:CoA:oxalate CoA-transferase